MVIALWITLLFHDKNFGVYIFAALFGAMAVPAFPIAMELGVELTFPISEEFSSFMLTLSSNIGAMIIHNLITWESDRTNSTAVIYTLSVAFALSAFVLFGVKPEYKRFFFEKDTLRKPRAELTNFQ